MSGLDSLLAGNIVGEGPGSNGGSKASGKTSTANLINAEHLPSEIDKRYGIPTPVDRESGRPVKMHLPPKFFDIDSGYAKSRKEEKPAANSTYVRVMNREQDYGTLKFAFDNALQETMDHLDIAKKSDFVNAKGEIKDIETAHFLLAAFRQQLVVVDPSREAISGSLKDAKKLDRREQLMFKILLERELGLNFNDSKSGETNRKYFLFNVPLAKLQAVNKPQAEAVA